MKNTKARQEYVRKYRAKNRDAIREYMHVWRMKNKEKMQNYNREYRVKNKIYFRDYDRRYRAANPEKTYDKGVRWRLAHPKEYKAYHRAYAAKAISRYNGLTYAEVLAKLKNQGGRCGICETKNPGKAAKWHGDHDHEAGHFRGVLCGRCNLGLGLFRDNQGVLVRAIVYLKENSAEKRA